MQTRILRIDEIFFDKTLYPRNDVDWITSVRYSESMKSGAKFPPIAIAQCNEDGKLYCVDGFHRVGALKNLKQEHCEAEFLGKMSKHEIYVESVKRNITHGRQFNSQERTKIILTLENWNLTQELISQIVSIPVDELKPFVAKRIARNNETEEAIALKSPLRHLAGLQILDVGEQSSLASRNQIQILDGVLTLLRNNWINLDSELIREKLYKILQLLKPLEKKIKIRVKK